MNLLHRYQNGTYDVEIYSDGTKIRASSSGEFISAFPENIDIKITNYCDAGCAFCHENSTVEGQHGKLDWAFLDTLRPGTELAIGGGNPLSHPRLREFLAAVKQRGVIANLTINQMHFVKSCNLLDQFVADDLVKGIGVSFMRFDEDFLEKAKRFENLVLHVINGVVRFSELSKLFGRQLKLLILGYKYLRRGIDYYDDSVEKRKEEIYRDIHNIIKNFEVVSFDNLGIEQLNVRRMFTNDEWERFYMGDDGNYTMYIDLVEGEYALSSTSLNRKKIETDVDAMFKTVKAESAQLKGA